MATAFVSLGGNVGDVADTFNHAVDLLNEECGHVVRLSSLYSTSAVGENAGPPFMNAAAEVETFLPPDELLRSLLQIESRLGRERSIHWGPRTLDLDLLLYEDVVLQTEALTLPHPRCWYRRFVLDPLAEVANNVVHPIRKLSIAKLKRRVSARPLEICVAGAESSLTIGLVQTANDRFCEVDAEAWQPHQPNEDAAMVIWHPDCEIDFEALPVESRLDLSLEHGEPNQALFDVLVSAGLAPGPAA